MKLELTNPVSRPIITQGFGENPQMYSDPKYGGIKGHNGIDFVAFDGTPVYASHDGHVTFAGYDGAGGLGVVIRTDQPCDNLNGAYAKSIYWHLKVGSVLVAGGDQVKAGQQIACADNTGASTGSHLHFGLKPIAKGENDWTWYNTEQTNRYNGAIDPAPYFIPFQQDLEYGMTDENVVKLQKELSKLGFFIAEPFAMYGEQTRKAVLAFQLKYCQLSFYERYILRGTKFGPKSRSALNALLGF